MIPPVNLDGGFSCAGNGLLYEGHARESPGQLRGLILPSGNQNGISDRDRPKSWWVAQNRFYGLPGSNSTPIGTLRSKLEEALRMPNGMIVPEKILNLESEGNRKYRDLLQLVESQTQKGKKQPATASKGQAPKAPGNKGGPATKKVGASSAKQAPSAASTTKAAKGKNASVPQATRFTMKTEFTFSVPQAQPVVITKPVRPKPTAKKPAGNALAKKRARSPSGAGGSGSFKRQRLDQDAGFGYGYDYDDY